MEKRAQMVSYPMANRKREAPCEQRRRLLLDQMNDARSHGDEAAALALLAQHALRDYWVFITEVLGLTQFDPWFHGEEVARFLCEHGSQSWMILLPRGCGKTTFVTVPFPAWRLASDPLAPTVVLNAREDKAQKMIRATAAILTNNLRYQSVFPHVRPSKKWGEAGYYLDKDAMGASAHGIERVEPAMMAYGVGGNLTGSHLPGAVLADDLINQDIARYPNQIYGVEEFFKEALTCADPASPVGVSGTRWTYFDFYQKILEGELLGTDGEPFRVLKLGITREDGSIIWPERTVVDMRGRQRTVGYTAEYVKAQKMNRGKLFSALYYNEPQLDADRQFDVNMIRQYTQLPFQTDGVLAAVIEGGAQQSAALLYPIRVMKEQQQRVLRIEELIPARKAKVERIKGVLQHLIASGNLVVRDDIWRGEKDGLGRELRDFDRGTDDCLDALCAAVMYAPEPPEGTLPRVVLGLDAAFSQKIGSDATAIIAACRYRGDVYVLDQALFRTDRMDVIVRKLFEMHDRWRTRRGEHLDRIRQITRGIGRRFGRHRVHTDPVRFEAPWEKKTDESKE